MNRQRCNYFGVLRVAYNAHSHQAHDHGGKSALARSPAPVEAKEKGRNETGQHHTDGCPDQEGQKLRRLGPGQIESNMALAANPEILQRYTMTAQITKAARGTLYLAFPVY